MSSGMAARCSAASNNEAERIIPEAAIDNDPPALASMLGSWIHSASTLAARFADSGAVPHVVIDDFFAEPMARALAGSFPGPDAAIWHVYDNPLERKRACNDVRHMPAAHAAAVCALCGPSLVDAVRRITGLAEDELLQADPYCHGGGLHSHGVGDKLDIHLDYSLHPVSGLERRFNLIVYLPSPDTPWESTYGGALELRGAAGGNADDAPMPGEVSAAVLPAFNRAVLFSTTAPSFHGFPRPLTCPSDVRRNSLALYYLTPPRPGAPTRSKALYVPQPGEPRDARMDRLREIRAKRRLDAADLLVLGEGESLSIPSQAGSPE